MDAEELTRRLGALGVDLSSPPMPGANYRPWVIHGDILSVAGQLPRAGERLVHSGRLGVDLDIETGRQAARLCGINVLSQLHAALGAEGMARIDGCLHLTGYIACGPDFFDHAKVIDGASDILVEVLGEAGRHARVSVGCISLPRNAPVEVTALFRIAG